MKIHIRKIRPFKSFFVTLLLTMVFQHSCFPKGYRNRIFTDKIETLQLYLNDNQLDYPVMRMNTSDHITVAFDFMSSDYPRLAYKLELCNADWTASTMDEMEYLQGMNEVVLSDPILSTNTTFDYSHFSFHIPNEDLKPILSGNYIVKVYDTESPEKILLTGCFSIDDNRVGVAGRVSGKSVYGVNTEYQHLTFELNLNEQFGAVPDELTVVVRQNGRHDNEVYDIKPTYVKPTEFIYDDERRLSFDGGREYNIIDFSHRYRYSGKIDKIAFFRPYYHVEVMDGRHDVGKEYAYDIDVDGRFKVHAQDVWSEAEIDYSIVHFTYPREEPWLDGNLYVLGGFNDNWLDEKNKMVYSFERRQYELALLLKNGGYNFLYAFLPADGTISEVQRTEGSHWETQNTYQIYVYYRPSGSAFDYDRLVGYFEIDSKD
mgnify:CR=1 FL=1